MLRKNLDIDSELDALCAKIKKRLTSQKPTLGEIVLESGVHKLFDADQLKEASFGSATKPRRPPPREARRREPMPDFRRGATTDRAQSPRAVALRISLAKLRRSEQALARLLKR